MNPAYSVAANDVNTKLLHIVHYCFDGWTDFVLCYFMLNCGKSVTFGCEIWMKYVTLRD